MHEIILPEAKPALEWVDNRVLQKVTPQRKHALAQGEFAAALINWSRDRHNGMAGTEWHFQVRPPGEISRTLVPDVAFLSYDRMPYEEQQATEIPRIAPDVVVEIRSPDDRQKDIDEKVRVYLAAGTTVLFLVDPETRTVTIRDAHGVRSVGDGDVLEHPALPGFTLQTHLLFDPPRPE
jgi:Uma2 family endonuclease